MKIALLTGAFKNAGDYLITERVEALLSYRYPDAEISRYARNKNLDLFLEEINLCDVVVFGGGPGWISDMYPEKFPLVSDLDSIVPPLFVLGMGCKTRDEKIKEVAFTTRSKELINRFVNDGYSLGCRDELTYQILKKSGIENALMTGCPAWYDLEYIHQNELKTVPIKNKIKRIVISDPGDIYNLEMAANLVSFCKVKYEPDEIVFAFHRGWNQDDYTDAPISDRQIALRDWLIVNGIKVVDLSYSADGFSIYDQCELHIGFRVHAHIYCLSHRIPSFLIEEDGRGFGVNETLGLPHISPKNPNRFLRAMQQSMGFVPMNFLKKSRGSSWIFRKLDDAICNEFSSNWQKHQFAFKRMEDTFRIMCAHIDEISNRIN